MNLGGEVFLPVKANLIDLEEKRKKSPSAL